MVYRGLHDLHENDKLQEENTEMKSVIRRLKKQNENLQHSTNPNNTSCSGYKASNPARDGQNFFISDSRLQQMEQAYRDSLAVKERKMIAIYKENTESTLRKIGGTFQHHLIPSSRNPLLPKPDDRFRRQCPLAPVKTVVGVDRKHLLTPISQKTTCSNITIFRPTPPPPAAKPKKGRKAPRSRKRWDGGVLDPEDVPLSLPEEVEQMQTHLRDEAHKVAREVRAMGRSVSAGGEGTAASSLSTLSPVDLSTPVELRALSALRSPAPVPMPQPAPVKRRSKLPHPKRIFAFAMAGNKADNAEEKKMSKEGLVGQRKPSNERLVGQRKPSKEGLVEQRKPSKEGLVGQRKPSKEGLVDQRKPSKEGLVEQRKVKAAQELTLQPLSKPDLVLTQTFKLLSSEDWEKKITGLTSLRALAEHHADIMMPKIHDICLAVILEVKNLRSVVSRAAMATLGHMYAHMRRGLDQEVEGTTRVLLHKAGECNAFIRKDVDAALAHTVQSCTPARVMHALLTTGLSHRNAAVRKCTAQHLETLADIMGASRLLSGKKDLTDRFLLAVSRFALDSSQEVRTHARNILGFLGTHEDCVKLVDKFVPLKDRATIKDIILKSRA